MPKLIVTKGQLKNKTFSFDKDVIFVGRSQENNIQIKEAAISRKHLKIRRFGNKIYIEDLVSKNGTYINGEMIVPGIAFEMSSRDLGSIGNIEFRLAGLPEDTTLGKKDSDPSHPRINSNKQKATFKEQRSFARQDLELFWKVTELLRKSMNINEVLERVLGCILESLPRIDEASVILLDEKSKKITKKIFKSKFENSNTKAHYSGTIVKRVISNRKSIRMSNTKYEPPENLSKSIIDLKISSIICVPMISNAKMLGVIYVDSRGAYGFRKRDLLLLNGLSGPLAVAVEKAMLFSKQEETVMIISKPEKNTNGFRKNSANNIKKDNNVIIKTFNFLMGLIHQRVE